MSNYHLLIIQHSEQFLKKREYLYIKDELAIFAMAYTCSFKTGEFLRGKPSGKITVLRYYTGIFTGTVPVLLREVIVCTEKKKSKLQLSLERIHSYVHVKVVY